MYSKKQHVIRKIIIVIVSFFLGIITTVIAAATYDANIQSRATAILSTIKSNATTMDPLDVSAYYTLVHLNVVSLMQVLTIVDAGISTELSNSVGIGDTDILTDSTGTTSDNITVSNSGTTASCGTRPTMGDTQSMNDYKNYTLKNYLEVKCTDYSYSSTILTGLEGTMQLSGDASKLVCDASTGYKWIFPNSHGLIPNGVHSCKISDKCSPVPTPSKTGRKYTKTTYGFYSDEIVQTCSQANRGNGTGVYMEGSYPKCDASTDYKWTKLEYLEIGNTCGAKTTTATNTATTNTATTPPTCMDLQNEYQCNQAKNNKYNKLIFSNANTVEITAISDCTDSTFRYMTTTSPTSWNGYIGAGWKACSSAPVATTTTQVVPTIEDNGTLSIALYGVPYGNGYSIMRGTKIRGEYTFSQGASNPVCQVWYSKNEANSSGDYALFTTENGATNTSSNTKSSFEIDTNTISNTASSFSIQVTCGGRLNGGWVTKKEIVTVNLTSQKPTINYFRLQPESATSSDIVLEWSTSDTSANLCSLHKFAGQATQFQQVFDANYKYTELHSRATGYSYKLICPNYNGETVSDIITIN